MKMFEYEILRFFPRNKYSYSGSFEVTFISLHIVTVLEVVMGFDRVDTSGKGSGAPVIGTSNNIKN